MPCAEPVADEPHYPQQLPSLCCAAVVRMIFVGAGNAALSETESESATVKLGRKYLFFRYYMAA